MTSCLPSDSPLFVLDIGSISVCGILSLPDIPVRECPRFECSALEAAESIQHFLEQHRVMQPIPQLHICMMPPLCSDSADRMSWWKKELELSSGDPCRCCHQTDPLNFLMDKGIAGVLAALQIPSLKERCWQEGVTVLWAGTRHVQAFLIYQDHICGLYEHHADIPKESLIKDLAELRLNWLPEEQVRASGGHGCICGNLPAEAEGFRPTWILGPMRHRFADCGKLYALDDDGHFDRCIGALSLQRHN
jgi:hypothetical protein